MKRYAIPGMIVLSAFLVALSFWFEALGIMILFAFVPLFVVLYQQDSVIHAGKYSFLFSFLTNLLVTSWLTSLYPMEFLGFDEVSGLFIFAGWFVFSLLLALPMFLSLLLADAFQMQGLRKCLISASLWTVMEWIMEFGDMGFPWFRISLPLANVSVLAQIASIIGSLGLSFIVIFINASLAMFVVMRKTQPVVGRNILLWSCLVLAGSAAYGIDRTQGTDMEDHKEVDLLSLHESKSVEVAVLQGNIGSDEKWERSSEWTHFNMYRDMSIQAIQNGSKLIVWPETALPVSLNEYDEMIHELQEIANNNNVTLVVGSFYEASPMPVGASFYRSLHDNEFVSILKDGLYNGLYAFPGNQLYAKQRLVPIGEYMPRWMMNALPLLRDFQLANQLTKAEEAALLQVGEMKIGGLICFESIFPTLSRTHIQNGANVLLIASNDAWYQGSAEIHQHKQHAIFRAIESNRYVIRGANTGISAVIDPTGRVLTKMGENTSGVITASIALIDDVSLYHQFPYIIIMLSILTIVLNGLRFDYKRLLSLTRYVKYSRVR